MKDPCYQSCLRCIKEGAKKKGENTWSVKAVTNTARNKEPVSSKLKSRSIGTPIIQATRTLNGT